MINYIFPFRKIEKGSKVLLWGAGKVGRDYYVQLADNQYCELMGIIDSACNFEDGLYKTKDILQSEFDYCIVAVEKEELYMEIRKELLSFQVSEAKIVWDCHRIDRCSATVELLQKGGWESLYKEYIKYALGDFSFFDDLIKEIKALPDKTVFKKSLEAYISSQISYEERTVLLRVLLLSDCFDSSLMEMYMNGLPELKNPELVVCLLYEIVWRELVHSEYRYPEYYNDRRRIIAGNTARLMDGVDLSSLPCKDTTKEIKKICYLRLNFPEYERSNATRRNLAIANELSDRGYDVEEIFVDLLEGCNVKGLMHFAGAYDIPSDNSQYVHDGLKLYFSKGKGIKDRMIDVLREIEGFAPDLIIDSCADYEMLSSILVEHYKIVQIPCRNTCSCTFMDRCIVSSQEIFEEDWNVFHSINKSKVRFLNKYLREELNVDVVCGCDREKYGIDKDKFVIATMGARIEQELPYAMVESLSRILKKYPNIIWLLVGGGDFTWIKRSYPELVNSGNIVFWGYENHADDFWKRLDVKLFVSPKVTGNGGCAYRALYNGCPVLINRSMGDIATILGTKRCIEGGYEEIADEVERMYLSAKKLGNASMDAKSIIRDLPSVKEYVDFVMTCAENIEE